MEKYGFVYIWYDRARKMFYIGSHWGTENDGYVCSSNWMRESYKRRREDFKRKTLMRIYSSRENLLAEEQYWLDMMKPEEMAIKNSTSLKRMNVRYYNLCKTAKKSWHYDPETRKTVGEKVSAAKKGKLTGPCSPEKAAAISAAKKAKFAERGGMSEEHKAALRGPRPNAKHTDEWKIENGKRKKAWWDAKKALA